jgi:hypothetical protein
MTSRRICGRLGYVLKYVCISRCTCELVSWYEYIVPIGNRGFVKGRGSDPRELVQGDIPQPKATLAIGPGAGFGFGLFIFGDASVVAEGRGVTLKVSVILDCETVAFRVRIEVPMED